MMSSSFLPDWALVMAGGSGERMHASGVRVPKPLVPVLGVTLLERNVHALLRWGFGNIIIATPAGCAEIRRFVEQRLTPLVKAGGGELVCFVEDRPMGNIGCASAFGERTRHLLVVYADNLTVLDLSRIYERHKEAGADMTIATHRQPFRMPFGEVRTDSGRVTAYVEKPVYYHEVCSAVSVLGPKAMKAIPQDRPTGLSALVQEMIHAGNDVRAFPHTAPWTDVNDAFALRQAEQLIRDHQSAFDVWLSDRHEARTLICESACGRVRLPKQAGGFRHMAESSAVTTQPFIAFDDFDEDTSRLMRFHVAARRREHAEESDGSWWNLDAALEDDSVSRIARRALALMAPFLEANQ